MWLIHPEFGLGLGLGLFRKVGPTFSEWLVPRIYGLLQRRRNQVCLPFVQLAPTSAFFSMLPGMQQNSARMSCGVPPKVTVGEMTSINRRVGVRQHVLSSSLRLCKHRRFHHH